MPTVLSFPIMPRPKIEDLPNRVRYWRKQRGLTLRQLAPIVGIAFPSLGKIETGKLDLRHYWMERIAAALDFTKVAELLPPTPQKPLGDGLKMMLSNQQTLSQHAEAQVADLITTALQPRRGKA